MKQFAFVLVVLLSLVQTSSAQPDPAQQVLEQLRATFPATWSHEDRGTFLNAAAWTLTQQLGEKIGLLRKPAGNRCPTPQQVDVSCDYLVRESTYEGFDVLVDENRPHWPGFGNPSDIFTETKWRFLDPVAPGGSSAPPQPPEPTPPPPPVDDVARLREHVDQVESWMQAHVEELRRLHTEVAKQIGLLNQQLLELVGSIPTRCRASLSRLPVSCRLE